VFDVVVAGVALPGAAPDVGDTIAAVVGETSLHTGAAVLTVTPAL
jgi:hypothetical protein